MSSFNVTSSLIRQATPTNIARVSNILVKGGPILKILAAVGLTVAALRIIKPGTKAADYMRTHPKIEKKYGKRLGFKIANVILKFAKRTGFGEVDAALEEEAQRVHDEMQGGGFMSETERLTGGKDTLFSHMRHDPRGHAILRGISPVIPLTPRIRGGANVKPEKVFSSKGSVISI